MPWMPGACARRHLRPARSSGAVQAVPGYSMEVAFGSYLFASEHRDHISPSVG
jgi:hypothetical protein